MSVAGRDTCRKLGAAPVLLAVIVMLIAACASDVHRARAARTNQGHVQLRLILDRTTAPADGTPIHGYLQVTNATGKPISITDACNGWIAVGLTNRNVAFAPPFTLDATQPPHSSASKASRCN